MINTFKFQLYKNDNNDAFYEFASSHEFGIKIEAVVWVMASAICYVFSDFLIWLVIPFVLSVYNIVLAWIKIHDAKFQVKKKSIKYMIEYSMSIVFLELKKLAAIMDEKQMKQTDIEKWKLYYINTILHSKNLFTINTVINNIKEHYEKITLQKFPDIKEKEIRKFIKKEAKDWWEKYYPTFKEDLENNQFGKQRNQRINIENRKVSSGKNIKLEENLKKMGLPGTVRDIRVVKTRYYELIKKYHPDAPQNKGRNPKEIQDKMIEVNIAYQEIEKIISNYFILGSHFYVIL